MLRLSLLPVLFGLIKKCRPSSEICRDLYKFVGLSLSLDLSVAKVILKSQAERVPPLIIILSFSQLPC